MRFLVVGETAEGRDQGRRAILSLGLECAAADAVAPDRLTDRAAAYPPVEAVLIIAGRGTQSAVEWVDRNLKLPTYLAGGIDELSVSSPLLRRIGGKNIKDELAREMNGTLATASGKGRWGRVTAILAAHSSTGATTIACGAAQWLNWITRSEVLVAEIGTASPDLNAVLGLDPPNGVSELIEAHARIDATMLRQAVAEHPSGLKVLGYRTEQDTPVAIPPEAARSLIHLCRGLYDWSVLDLGHSLSEGNQAILRVVETIVLPIVLDVPGLKRARHLLRRLEEQELASKVLIGVNHYGQRGALAWQDAVTTLGRPIDIWLPDDARPVNSARNEGQPVSAAARGSALSKALKKLAKLVADRTPAARH